MHLHGETKEHRHIQRREVYRRGILLVSDTTQPNTALQMPQPLAAEHPPLRVTPSHDLRSCAPDMVDNQNTAPLYISASRNDPLSIAHDTAQPDSISPEIISDRRGIKETTYSNVR